jgi:anthranilate synthase/aminodeoxychorismate synthase-like glutamine amidotransferase
MIYVVDHQDSFTYNLVHLLSNFDTVYVSSHSNINYLKIRKSKLIVLSPGPGEPKNYPETSILYKQYKGKKKILGICLGFQQILYNENGKIIQQKKIFHGHQSRIDILKSSKLFRGTKSFKVGKYHSLKLKEPFKSKNTLITMRCAETKVAMAIENIKSNVYGFQFHPESFLTPNGKYIIKKILSA